MLQNRPNVTLSTKCNKFNPLKPPEILVFKNKQRKHAPFPLQRPTDQSHFKLISAYSEHHKKKTKFVGKIRILLMLKWYT